MDTVSESNDIRFNKLQIVKGARHCKIVNETDETIFRTTNQRDAERFLEILEENRRLHHLLEARGIAPHRIYRLEGDETHSELVIVAKHSAESVIVRHLADGREEVADLDDVQPIVDLDYFVGADRPVETIHIGVRVDKENDLALITATRSLDGVRASESTWRKSSFELDKNDAVQPSWSDNDCLIFTEEVVIED